MSGRGKGNLGEVLGAAGSEDQVVPEGQLGHDCHLDAVLSVHGRSPRFLTLIAELGCVLPREPPPLVPQTHSGTFSMIL